MKKTLKIFLNGSDLANNLITGIIPTYPDVQNTNTLGWRDAIFYKVFSTVDDFNLMEEQLVPIVYIENKSLEPINIKVSRLREIVNIKSALTEGFLLHYNGSDFCYKHIK